VRSLTAARSGRPAQFSQLLELAGVYKEGDKPPPPARTAAQQTAAAEAVFPQAAEEDATTTKATAERLTAYNRKAAKTAATTTTARPPRKEKLIDDGDDEDDDEFRAGYGGGFMPRASSRNLPFSPSYPRIPLPTPDALGFPRVESFMDNFERSVRWKDNDDIDDEKRRRRGRREAEASLLAGGHHHHHHAGHGVSPNDLLPLPPPPPAPLLHIDHQVCPKDVKIFAFNFVSFRKRKYST
jgi:hypothetical protein